MLDSNNIIALVTNDNDAVVRRAGECDEDEIVTSAIAFAEVAYGSMQEKPPLLTRLCAFAEEVPILPFDDKAALVYASLPFRRGRFDRLIAAHALSRDLILVTNNLPDFADMPELYVENWAR
jgi:tRNA(fMet)-specific endonuclease VapC